MEQVDYKMLKEDVKFPLRWDCEDYKMYIFDSNNCIVAQVYDDNFDVVEQSHPFEKIIGGLKEIKVFESNPRYTLYQGDFYDTDHEEKEPIGCVRGWGRLQYKNRPEQRQDNIAAYILNVINNL